MLIDKYDVNIYEAIIRSSTGCEEIQSRGLLHSASYSAHLALIKNRGNFIN